MGEGEFADADAFASTRLDLELIAMRETDYYRKLTDFYKPVRMMVWITALLIALGGVFGGLNTMYAAFAARIREIGMLQSLGFSRLAVVVSFMQESVLAAAAGALIGAMICLWLLDGLAVRFSMGRVRVDPRRPYDRDRPSRGTCVGAGRLVAADRALPAHADHRIAQSDLMPRYYECS